ncbi:MAG: hypothetical protein GY708_22090 [Actinomycetia bacterium]|nr:hypothetical protein [Actinomycetes bacterium]MCP4958031.1 hypothetical protein [Actinomycetes bacterium]
MVDTRTEGFEEFVRSVERRLEHALVAAFGVDIGLDAAAEALSYGWQHWDRISAMENPAGYLYRVGHNHASKAVRRPTRLPRPEQSEMPWIEPALPDALDNLPEKQRVAVLLVHTFGYSLAEAADVLGVAKGTLQTHVARGLANLRKTLGVTNA